mmetsp:Transcript_111037/g.313142  ORF Transcript_111037/g.313142 Transcript_111037/m.313142 type:complete len:139 (-) Transcript_111037:505-921(-)
MWGGVGITNHIQQVDFLPAWISRRALVKFAFWASVKRRSRNGFESLPAPAAGAPLAEAGAGGAPTPSPPPVSPPPWVPSPPKAMDLVLRGQLADLRGELFERRRGPEEATPGERCIVKLQANSAPRPPPDVSRPKRIA